MFCSSFQHPFYPHSGYDSQAANVVNAPLPSGASSMAFREAVETHWLPRLAEFAPQLILVSAGFDAHVDDDMSNVSLTDADFRWVTEQIVAIAASSASGRVISVLEGGYELNSLARCAEQHVRILMGLH